MSLLNGRTIPALSTVVLLALGAGALALADEPAVHEVTMANSAFTPAELEIAAGETVRFTNDDYVTHNVVVTDGPRTPALRNGQSAEMTFADAGTYDYICSFHRDMGGRIVVN